MSLFLSTLAQIKENAQRKREGKYNSIPFRYKALNRYVPGIMPEIHYGVTAGTGAAKSKFTRRTFVLDPYFWVKENPNKGLDCEIIYFTLEDSANKVQKAIITDLVYRKHRIEIDPLELDSFMEHETVNETILSYIEECTEEALELEKKVHIVDNIHNPYGMYSLVKKCLERDGVVEEAEYTDASGKVQKRFKRYIPNNPGKIWIIVVDNLSNIHREKGHANDKEAIDQWCKEYVREDLCGKYKCAVVDVQQQAGDKERGQFTSSGNLIVEKLLPSIDGLGETKVTSRTYHVLFGLFAPNKHRIPAFDGYNIAQFGDRFRMLSIIKSNIGDSDVSVDMFFDGLLEQFVELPKPEDKQALQKILDHVKDLDKRRDPRPGDNLVIPF